MPRPNDTNPYALMTRSWLLGMEAAQVVGLRSLRLMQGGKVADREAQRMVTEKITASSALWMRLWSEADWTGAADAALDVATPRVPANRRRLSR
ncbi:hypothetical protein WJT74_11170 [Sphingomicrobium sp. XHP0239]|uniref:hypothetical protein n=1 Tax=Sphingomicrobium maritimum TaxID=3133972 RepID=UPI0031CC87C9